MANGKKTEARLRYNLLRMACVAHLEQTKVDLLVEAGVEDEVKTEPRFMYDPLKEVGVADKEQLDATLSYNFFVEAGMTNKEKIEDKLW